MPKINIKESEAALRKEAKTKIIHYITTALGLVAGLAWNDAVKGVIEYLFPLQQDTILAKFIYAIIITLILVIITMLLTKIFSENNPAPKTIEE